MAQQNETVLDYYCGRTTNANKIYRPTLCKLYKLTVLVQPTVFPLTATAISRQLIVLNRPYVSLGLVETTVATAVVSAQAMDVAREGGEVSACEEGRAGAHDALDHADRVGIHVAQHTLALKVT